MAGQEDEVPHITIKMRALQKLERNAVSNDSLFIWDDETDQLKYCNIDQLPFGSGGGGSTTAVGSPFKVRDDDEQAVVVSDGSGGFNTIISDVRLLGKEDYPVNSTQLNNSAFRDSELIYNKSEGKVTILGFSLQSGEFVILYPDGIPAASGPGGSLQGILDRLTLLEMMVAPFKPTVTGPGGGAVLWMKPAVDIPIGWIEDVSLRGKFPMGADPDVTGFSTVGDSGGRKNFKIVMDNIPAHRFYTIADQDLGIPGFPWDAGRALSPTRSKIKNYFKTGGSGKESYASAGASSDSIVPSIAPTNTLGKVDNDAIDLMNPFRIVHYIKFQGVE